jgi:hypothetical protein
MALRKLPYAFDYVLSSSLNFIVNQPVSVVLF